jgi:hypothetical protein
LLFLFAILGMAVEMPQRADAGVSMQVRQTLVLFLGFLPLLNAWADFASIGLTRWRLRAGLQGHLIWNVIVDGLAALGILLLLAFAIIATVYFIRPQDCVPLIDLASLLPDLRENPAHYWWLGFLLFSTLLPTALHLVIGCFAFFTLFSGWSGRPIADGLTRGDSPGGRTASSARRWRSGCRVFCSGRP